MYADVAVCLPLSRTFVYKLERPVAVGCRVLVEFRRREVEGFIVGLRSDAPKDVEVHGVKNFVDSAPLLRPEIFDLCKWISQYYVSPIGEVLKSALPPGINEKHIARGLKPTTTRLERREGMHVERLPLTADQSRALDSVCNARGFYPMLLHGVTGSGKTEIYMRAAEHFLERGKTSLILVPEIGLTPQLTDRFAARFPGKIAILHSALTKRQRIDEWLRIRAGETPIVIGTRSAVFAPLQNLGMIVVDEEHETSYKQEDVPRYHARDTAVMRAKLSNAAVILGSATPSMESFHNSQRAKYLRIPLTTRVEDRELPDVQIVNMREEYAAQGKQVVLSQRLLQALFTRLERQEQTMILLNRR